MSAALKFQHIELSNGAIAVRKQYTDPVSGRRGSLTCPTELEAADKLERIERIRRDLRYGAISQADARRLMGNTVGEMLTVKAIWEDYAKLQKPHRERMVNADRARLGSLEKLPAIELTETVMRQWALALEARDYASKTIRNTYDQLQAAFNLAIRSRLIDSLPWGNWRPTAGKSKKREACRSLEEFTQVVLAAREQDSKAWNRGVYSAQAYLIIVVGLVGMRQGEAAGLGWDDVEIDSDPPMIHINHQAIDQWPKHHPEWTRPLTLPKGDKARHALLHSSVVAALWAQREELKRRGMYRLDGPVFPSERSGKRGLWRTHASVIKPERFRKIVEAAGLPVGNWTTHSLRHTFATLECVASGGDLRSVASRTGHTSLRILEGYLHEAGRGLPQSFVPDLNLNMNEGRPTQVVDSLANHIRIVQERARAVPLLPASSTITEAAPYEPSEVARFPMVSGALVDLVGSTRVHAKQYEEIRKEAKRQSQRDYRAKYPRTTKGISMKEIAIAKIAQDDWTRPPEITAAGSMKYMSAYSLEMRQSGNKEKARQRGRLAKQNYLSSYTRIVKQLAGDRWPGELTPRRPTVDKKEAAAKEAAAKVVNEEADRKSKDAQIAALQAQIEKLQGGGK